jgi:hypothetical protein
VENYFGEIWLISILIKKGVALIYFVAFLSAYNQFPALLGEHGLLPVQDYLNKNRFAAKPSIFHWYYSDRYFKGIALFGTILSLVLVFGFLEHAPLWISMILWLMLWLIYLSIVNVGQTFYAFGWESMLLEAGFITAFLGNSDIQQSFIPILILRWMLFRTELGAGLIKLRHDACWRDLTCLFYHYETQPLPNPLSWFFHRLPKFVHRFSVFFSHLVQLVAPFGLFAPQPVASIAGVLIISHQLFLILSGNYSWLNWLTVVLGFSAFSDTYLWFLMPLNDHQTAQTPFLYDLLLYLLAGMVIFLSWKPILNLFSKNQFMNFSYNPFHLINTYGAFGAITKNRYEIIIEGTLEKTINSDTKWCEYEFKAKPGPLKRCPPLVAPYHLRLDWLMWFLPFSVHVQKNGIYLAGYEFWFIKFIEKLLRNDKEMVSLLKKNPFTNDPPKYIRARFFHYKFTNFKELFATKAWWTREYLGDYLPPISLKQLGL